MKFIKDSLLKQAIMGIIIILIPIIIVMRINALITGVIVVGMIITMFIIFIKKVFLTQDGRNIDVSQVIIAHKNPEGEVKYLSTIDREITGRSRMEDILRKSENKYKILLENLPQKIFYKDRNSVYVFCNENYARDLKIHADEIEGKTDYDFYPAELAGKYRADDKRIMESGKSEELKETYLIDGVETTVRTIKTPIKDDKCNISGILCIFWDITEYMRAAEEQKRLREQLYHMHQLESISTLAGGVAHDFNNILALVMGYGSLLEKEMGKDDPLRTYVQKILDSAERATNLTSGLLTFSRKQQTANFKPVHVNETVRKTERFLLQLIGKEIRIKTVLTDKDCVVLGNSNQIEQVLINLATNAKGAMPGGGSLVIRTDVVALDGEQIIKYDHCEAGMYACISVSDTGVGMDNNTKARIFEPFFTTKEVGKGTGIGLSIVHGIVKQHKGFVDVMSRPGKGTTFKIYIPITESGIEEIKERE